MSCGHRNRFCAQWTCLRCVGCGEDAENESGSSSRIAYFLPHNRTANHWRWWRKRNWKWKIAQATTLRWAQMQTAKMKLANCGCHCDEWPSITLFIPGLAPGHGACDSCIPALLLGHQFLMEDILIKNYKPSRIEDAIVVLIDCGRACDADACCERRSWVSRNNRNTTRYSPRTMGDRNFN